MADTQRFACACSRFAGGIPPAPPASQGETSCFHAPACVPARSVGWENRVNSKTSVGVTTKELVFVLFSVTLASQRAFVLSIHYCLSFVIARLVPGNPVKKPSGVSRYHYRRQSRRRAATPRLDLRVSSLIRALRARFARAQSIHGAPGDFFSMCFWLLNAPLSSQFIITFHSSFSPAGGNPKAAAQAARCVTLA